MRFWGIGASGTDGNFEENFINRKSAYINWSEETAPTLYQMLRKIAYGDIVYIKSYTIRGNVITVKAIGIVIGECGEDCSSIKVKWFDTTRHKISVAGEKNNVYSNTLYEEFNNEIVSYLKERLLYSLKDV